MNMAENSDTAPARQPILPGMTKPRLVLFTRYPKAGECKTRLIPALGSEAAANLHRQLTERTVSLLAESGLPVTVAFTGAEKSRFEDWLGPEIVLVEQVGGGLTERLLACLDPAPVIFFGADTPDLAPHHVGAAVAALERHDVVIGPAEDGGYYLIGMRTTLPDLLVDMPWSTADVLPETLARLDHMGITPVLLETLADCDRPEDLERWPDLRLSCASRS